MHVLLPARDYASLPRPYCARTQTTNYREAMVGAESPETRAGTPRCVCVPQCSLHSRRGRAFPVSHGDATHTDASKGSPTTNTMLCTLSLHCPCCPFGQSMLFLSSASVLASSIYVRLSVRTNKRSASSSSLGTHEKTISDLVCGKLNLMTTCITRHALEVKQRSSSKAKPQ